jgi:hypothetical protein
LFERYRFSCLKTDDAALSILEQPENQGILSIHGFQLNYSEDERGEKRPNVGGKVVL